MIAASSLVAIAGHALGAQRATFTDAHGSREYVVYRPSKMSPRPRALVVMLHGCTQSADDFARGTRMNDAAEREGFLVLYPEQPAAKHPQKCWNWYSPDQVQRDQGEMALLFALIDSVARAENIGAGRVSVVGMSAGGAMAANLAAAYPERVAALGIHSGISALAALDLMSALKVMREGAEASALLDGRVIEAMGLRARAIPVIALHGADDKVVAPANLDRIVDQWTKVNLRVSPQARTPVERHVLPGVGHAWSGGAADASYTAPTGPDATGMIVEFLRRVGAIG